MVIAAGGTGGHLFPGIAVAQRLKEIDPQGTISFIGSERGVEQGILQREGFPREALPVGRIKGENLWDRVRTVIGLPRSLWQARSILSRLMPDLVFGIGGYSSGPVILAAFLMKIPRAILEPNSIPGFTNRLLGHLVNKVFIAFPEATRFFPRRKILLTGTPVRGDLTEIAAARSEIPPLPPFDKGGMGGFPILVLGGSQGATALNRAMVDLLPALKQSGRAFSIVHQTGSNDFDWVRKAYESCGIPSKVLPFIVEIASVYREANLVISRAGASTIAELIETRSPSILVPYPYAADDHQRFNALSLVRVGGAEMILNQELAGRLAERLFHYESHREELQRMSEGLRRIRKVPAAEAVARECLLMVKE